MPTKHLVFPLFALTLAGVGCARSQEAVAPTPTPATAAAALAPAGPAVVETTLEAVGLETAAIDRTVNPCDDFYQFACGGWLARAEIPADKSRWSRSFNEIDKRNEEELHRILEAAKASPGDDPTLQKIGAYYGACMDETAIEAAGTRPIDRLLGLAQAIKDRKTLGLALIELHKYRIPAVFDVSAEQDFKQATQVIAYLDQNGLGMPDRDYYTKDDEKSKELRGKYVAHVERMLKLTGVATAQAAKSAQAVLRLETELAKVSKTRVERRDPASLYNKIDRAGIVKATPAFPWEAYFKALGAPDVQDIVVTSVPFFEGVQKLLEKGSLDDWRAYLQWTVARSSSSMLPKAFVDESFTFVKDLTGQAQIEDRWKRCVDATDRALGELLAQPFIATMFAGDSKPATEKMVFEISKAFGQELDRLDWMDDQTRGRAHEKLKSFVYHIGYPLKWKAYEFQVEASFGANVLASRAFELQRDLAKIGKPVDREEWQMSPPTVNAYYNPLKNEMVFPAGILQPPFFSAKSAIPVNMGGMGMVVGHELTHGFDDEGSKFAFDGNLKNWWEPAVEEKFAVKTKCVEEQYAKYEALPDVKLNGKLTLGENIADLGGVKLAFKAYRAMRKDAKDRVVADGFSEDQQFFLAVGQAWCMKARDEVARMLATTDPHSPPRWRVNGSLTNTAEFSEAFECAPGTRMRPADACKVW